MQRMSETQLDCVQEEINKEIKGPALSTGGATTNTNWKCHTKALLYIQGLKQLYRERNNKRKTGAKGVCTSQMFFWILKWYVWNLYELGLHFSFMPCWKNSSKHNVDITSWYCLITYFMYLSLRFMDSTICIRILDSNKDASRLSQMNLVNKCFKNIFVG